MKRLAIAGVCLVLTLVGVGPALADTAAECQGLVESCVVMFKDKGKEAALKAIDDRGGPFVRGEIYVFAMDMENVVLAHPHDKSVKRVNMSNLKDMNGKPFMREFREVARSTGAGWVAYTWAKPGEQTASPKRSYIMKVPGEEIYIGAGYYEK